MTKSHASFYRRLIIILVMLSCSLLSHAEGLLNKSPIFTLPMTAHIPEHFPDYNVTSSVPLLVTVKCKKYDISHTDDGQILFIGGNCRRFTAQQEGYND